MEKHEVDVGDMPAHEIRVAMYRNLWKSALQKNVINLTFTKKNGEVRKMTATLMPEHLPEMDKEQDEGGRRTSPEVLNVWDMEKEAWRAFRIETVTEWDGFPVVWELIPPGGETLEYEAEQTIKMP